MLVEVRLYATLREYSPPDAVNGVFSARLPAGARLADLMTMLGITANKVHLRMVNGVGVTEQHLLQDADRIGLFPPIGGG